MKSICVWLVAGCFFLHPYLTVKVEFELVVWSIILLDKLHKKNQANTLSWIKDRRLKGPLPSKQNWKKQKTA